MAPATPRWAASARARLAGSARATTATTSSRSGTAAVAFTIAPTERTAVAGSSFPANTRARAPAIERATSRSLLPLATDWNSTTGFSPIMATAKASRSGRTLRTSGARTAIVARLAAIAMNRNATIDAVTPPNIRATPDDNNVNRGPYTAGVPTHRGPTYCASGSDGKSDGVATYGFALWTAAILP